MYEKGGRRTYSVRWSLFLSLNDSPYLIFRFWHTSTKASADILTGLKCEKGCTRN